MSALSFITEYGSDESDEDNTEKVKKLKLQVPNLDKVPVVTLDAHVDNPQVHNGRIRSFPHVRGNWPSYVYVRYPKEETLQNFIDKAQNCIKYSQLKDSCYRCDDFHISVSKTVVLQYHLITSFTKSLQEYISDVDGFDLQFSSVDIYCNEDNTRTFISLKVDYWTKKSLLQITDKVDKTLNEYKLPPFYKDPSFHMSTLWLTGNKKAELLPFLEQFNDFLSEEIGETLKNVYIDNLNCKIGNKFYQFTLQ